MKRKRKKKQTRVYRLLYPSKCRHPRDSLARHGDNIWGSIRYRGQFYQVTPLGGGEHVIVKVDETKYPDDLVVPGDQSGAVQTIAQPSQALSIIRVMLIFTKQASEAWPDTQGLGALMFAEANQGMRNSAVRVHFENAGVFPINYSDQSGADGYKKKKTPTNDSPPLEILLAR